MPIKTKRVKQKHSPWLNDSIFDLMKQRDKMKKKAKVTRNEDDWKSYRKMRNTVTYEIKKAKKLYYSDKIRDCQSRKNSWEILKLLLPNKSTDSFNIMNSKHDKIANEFNKHFANVAASICTNEYVPILEERPICYENSFELSPVHWRTYGGGGGRGGRVPPLTGSRGEKKKGGKGERKKKRERKGKKKKKGKGKKKRKEREKRKRKEKRKKKRKGRKREKEKERKKMGKLKKKNHGRTHRGEGGQLTPDILKTYSFFPENVV